MLVLTSNVISLWVEVVIKTELESAVGNYQSRYSLMKTTKYNFEADSFTPEVLQLDRPFLPYIYRLLSHCSGAWKREQLLLGWWHDIG